MGVASVGRGFLLVCVYPGGANEGGVVKHGQSL